MRTEQLKIFNQYETLRNEVILKADQLHQEHKSHTKCKKGCADCCMNFSVFPIEFHFILNHINQNINIQEPQKKDECIFLDNEKTCSIYNWRPFICITHGLPILHLNDDTEEWELSFCPLNFNNADDEYFNMENTLEFDSVNSRLFQLNKQFVALPDTPEHHETDLIELNTLKNFI